MNSNLCHSQMTRHERTTPETDEGQYVNYGCGHSAPRSWTNFDASMTLRLERLPFIGKLIAKNEVRFPDNVEYGDIVKGLPVPDSSCKAVYCSHVLEHLSLDDCRTALRNTYRILKKSGTFRLVVPDLEYLANKYLDDRSTTAAVVFMKESALGKERRRRGLIEFAIEWLGNSSHLWMWDFSSIERELTQVGFVGIRRARFGDASISEYTDIEEKVRWENCLGVECKK